MIFKMTDAGKAILKTIVYYNCLDYPLTLEELKNFSSGPKNLEKELKDLVNDKLIESYNGFYFLKGRKDLADVRRERNEIAKRKRAIALKGIKWLQMVPYLKLVFASGSLALSNTDKESDLDVLIVVKSGRIWTSRFLTVILLGMLGVRRKRHQALAPDKICLNHFITDKSLYIPRKSIYTAQLYARLVPILLDSQELLEEFIKQNSWVGEYIPKFPISNFQFPNKFQVPNSKFLNLIRKIGEKVLDTKIGDWLEAALRKYQLRRINSYHLTYKPGGRVKADDYSLEFHPDSPELKIIAEYNKKMIELEFPELGEERDSGLLHD